MQNLAPSERLLVGFALYPVLGQAYRFGSITIPVSSDLSFTYTPDIIKTVISKLDIYDSYANFDFRRNKVQS